MAPINQMNGVKASHKGPYHKVLSDQFMQFKPETKPFPGISESKCFMCNVTFGTSEEQEAHTKSNEHKFREQYRMNRRDVKKNSSTGIVVEFEQEEIFLEVNQQKKINFKLVNQTDKETTLLQILELMKFNVEPGIQILGSPGVSIKPGGSIPYKMIVGFGQETGIYVYPLIFQFLGSAGSTYVYRELTFYAMSSGDDSDLFAALAPVSDFKLRKKCFIHLVEVPTIYAPPLKSNSTGDGLPKKVPLKYNPVPSLLAKLVNHSLQFEEFQEDLTADGKKQVKKYLDVIKSGAPNCQVLNKNNYRDRFSILLFLEEMQINKEMADYNMNDVSLFEAPTLKTGYLALKIPGLVENRPCVVQGDCVYITMDKDKAVRYQGRVAHVNMESVELLFDPHFYRIHNIGDTVSVQFEVGRYPYMAAHRAIEYMCNFDIAFPATFKDADPDSPIEYYDDKIRSNPEQMQAVRNCLDGTSSPAPYIIFGPPGTGKTSTLIEIIKQLWVRASQRGYKIMVCAPSNAAADLITELLMNAIPVNDVFRLYSLSRSYASVPDRIKESNSSNFDAQGNVWYPDVEKLKAYKILITTLVAATRLVTAGFGMDNHFSHIIIDECGQAHEPEAMIPISGFAGAKPRDGVRRPQIILAGDPNQLGPIIISKLAAHMGLDISLLERLMELELYKKDKTTGKYNSRVITKLVLNHRSHGAIIEASNKLFYDNELQVNGDKKVINMAVGWSELPNKKYPVIFHGVKGQEERESSSPSWFNRLEIITIMNYLKKILKPKTFNGHSVKPEDIGIISPYHKQVMKLRHACELERWSGIKIGSVEEFQGSEKLITIVSTVRSNQEVLCQDLRFSLGFLSNPKRMNVALTRARALMIVVGDPDVLLCDPRWKTFILQCRNNNACVSEGYFNNQALEEINGLNGLTDDFKKIKIGK